MGCIGETMSKLKLSKDYSQNRVEDLEIRKSVQPVTAPRFKPPFWLQVACNALVSGGIGIGCAWLALFALGKI